MEIYLRTTSGLDDVAAVLARSVNVDSTNQSSYQREQRRESQNRGGIYYLFEVFGLELILLQNRGEVEVPERSAWPFYLLIDGQDFGREFLAGLCSHLASVLRKADLEVEIDDLAA